MKNMKVSRRGFLGGMAVAPLGAEVLNEDFKRRMLNGAYPSLNTAVLEDACPEEVKAKKIYSFADWLSKVGNDRIKRQAWEIDGFDPDLIAMQSMSFVAKVAIQRRRNLKTIMENKKKWFQGMIESRGHVSWHYDDYY